MSTTSNTHQHVFLATPLQAARERWARELGSVALPFGRAVYKSGDNRYDPYFLTSSVTRLQSAGTGCFGTER